MSETMIGHAEPSPESVPPPVEMTPVKPPDNPERWKTLIIVLTMINTILVAVIAGLQTDANIRANAANRDSQYYAVLTSSELQRVGLQSNYDMNTFSRVLDNTQRSLVMQFTALELLQAGDPQAASLSEEDGRILQAQADTARKFSMFYRDPRYAPQTPEGQPDLKSYIEDSNAAALELLAKQNAASDAYKIWSGKADSYVAVLTILAIAFFLFGIGQSVNPRLRLLFAAFGIVVIVLGVGWGLAILVA